MQMDFWDNGDATSMPAKNRIAELEGTARYRRGVCWALLAGGAIATAVSALGQKPVNAKNGHLIPNGEAPQASSRRKQSSVRSNDPCFGSPCSGCSTPKKTCIYEATDADTPSSCSCGCQRTPMLNKRGNLDSTPEYPRKNFKPSTPGTGNEKSYASFQQSLREARLCDLTSPSPAQTLSPGSPRSTAKHLMVHRLRQQLKNRDEMILQMQTQILEQGRSIHLQHLRTADLEELLRTTNISMFQAQQEIERLRSMLSRCICQTAVTSQLMASRKAAQPFHKWQDYQPPQDMLVSEARSLAEVVKAVHEEKKQERDMIIDMQSDEYEVNVQKIEYLESELSEANKVIFEKEMLLENCEREKTKLTNAFCELQHKLETQAVKLEQMRARKTGTDSDQSSITEPLKAFTASNNTNPSNANDARSIEMLCSSSSQSSNCSTASQNCYWGSYHNSHIEDERIASGGLSRYGEPCHSEIFRAATPFRMDECEFRGGSYSSPSSKAKKSKSWSSPSSYNHTAMSPECKNKRSSSGASEWSLREEVARLASEMEQVKVDEKGLQPMTCEKKNGGVSCSADDSMAVRIGSPTISGDVSSSVVREGRRSSIGGGSFGGFLFDMNQDNRVVLVNDVDSKRASRSLFNEFGSPELRPPATSILASLSPFSKMMVKLDLRSSGDAVSVTDSLVVVEKRNDDNDADADADDEDESIERKMLTMLKQKKRNGGCGSCSLDSAFDKVLDNTLQDLVRICSPCKLSDSESDQEQN